MFMDFNDLATFGWIVTIWQHLTVLKCFCSILLNFEDSAAFREISKIYKNVEIIKIAFVIIAYHLSWHRKGLVDERG